MGNEATWFKKGHTINLGKKRTVNNCKCIVCGSMFYRKPSWLKKFNPKYCSLKCKHNDMLGNKATSETKRRMSESQKKITNNGRFKKGERTHPENWFKRGENSTYYIDGKTSLLNLIRTSWNYKQWRSDVFLCEDCHKLTKTYGCH